MSGAAAVPARRELSFATLDEMVADAENLLEKGYDRAGNWDLAQVCGHLADWMRFPLDGFPRLPLLLRPAAWLVRNTVGRGMREKILVQGFPRGGRTLTETVPPAGGDAATAVARLREIAGRWKTHTGDLIPSPLFGRMDRETWIRFQLRHAAHHLSFLVPKTV